MDILHAQLAAIQRKLAFVQVDPIDWKTYVLVSSWAICFFESYLLYALIMMCSSFSTDAHDRKFPRIQPAAISAFLKVDSAHCPC